MRIGSWDLDERVLVVAEIGNNHEGDLSRAEDMIRRAAEAGAGAVKFQTVQPEALVARSEEARLEQLRRFALADDAWPRLADVAESCGVMFLSTPFHLDAVRRLDPLVPAFKVASGDNDFSALLRAVAATGKPVLLSTGMTGLDDVRRARAILDEEWTGRGLAPGLVLLHCVVSYPTPPDQANLSALADLAAFDVVLGYSDHTIGTAAAPLAVALGARVIEKHFTLDKAASDFRDHQLSADPEDLAQIVAAVKHAEELLGSGGKRVLPCEEPLREGARRSIATARDLKRGDVVSEGDVTWLRPATGWPPGDEAEVVGRRLVRDIAAGSILLPADVE